MSNEKRPPRDWEGVVDRQIRDAIEQGDFDNVAGRGKPIDLEENPFGPRDWRLAYKVMKDAGVSPEWIEQDKAIRTELVRLAGLLQRSARSLRGQAAKAKTLMPDQIVAEHKRLTDERERVCAYFRERATDLNRQIDLFNLKVPIARLQHTRVPIEKEIEQFLKQAR